MPKTTLSFYIQTIIIAAIVVAISCFIACYRHTDKHVETPKIEKTETVYQRVQRTNTIRCGYTSWDPLFFVDTKTNEKKGFFMI